MGWDDIGRIAFTVFCFTVFVVVLVGACSKKSTDRYHDAANLPFNDNEQKNDPDDRETLKDGARNE